MDVGAAIVAVVVVAVVAVVIWLLGRRGEDP